VVVVGRKINFWSFILSLLCIFLLYLTTFSVRIGNSIFGIHPLMIVLCITWVSLLLGAIGFTGVQDWKSLMRSIATLIITSGLAVFLTYVVFFGSLLQAI